MSAKGSTDTTIITRIACASDAVGHSPKAIGKIGYLGGTAGQGGEEGGRRTHPAQAAVIKDVAMELAPLALKRNIDLA